jgi:hypothetical protein
MKHIIGFASQYYTLWSYSIEKKYTTDAYGNHHLQLVEHRYNYIKNVSTDLAKAIALHQDAELDMELRGTSSFHRNEKHNLPNNYFWAGKYCGQLIDEIIERDLPYCIWAYNKYNNSYIGTHPVYTAHMQGIEKQKQQIINSAKPLQTGDVVELKFVRNGYVSGDELDEIWTEALFGEINVLVRCSGGKHVNGMYPYIMPKINNKYQRTKNKTISVKVIDVYSTSIIGCSGNVHQQIRIM